MKNNCMFLKCINKIGGIETFLYEIAKIYKNYDLTIYYESGDTDQIKRLKKYVRVKQYKDEKIKCKTAIFNYQLFGLENIEAEEIIQVIHADYKAIKLKPIIDNRVTKYIAVSKQVANVFEELTGKKCEVIYNPIEVDKPKKVLNLVSATRLTFEKGKDRIIKLAKMLDEAKIPYLWTIFTNDIEKIDNPSIVYMKPRLDIRDYIANADYTVQLSDTEGYCYTVQESLVLGTPVIVTDIPSFQEMGVKNGVNAYVLDFELKEVPIKEIYKGLPKFEYKPKKNEWDKYLASGESEYQKELKTMVEVQCISRYNDIDLGVLKTPEDEPYKVNEVRAEELEKLNFIVRRQ